MLPQNASACTALHQIVKILFLLCPSVNLKSEFMIFSENPGMCSHDIPSHWLHFVSILPCDSLEGWKIDTSTQSILLCDFETNLAILNATSASQGSRWSQLFIVASWSDIDSIVQLEHPLILEHSATPGIEMDVVLITMREKAPIFHRFDYWNSRPSVSHTENPCPRSERDRADLQGVKLNATVAFNAIYHFDTNISTSSGRDTKLEASFAVAKLHAFEYAMNFSTAVHVAQNWGYFNKETQKWSGMIGDLLDKRAHFAIPSSTDLPARREVVDFMLPTSTWSLRVFYRKPRNSVALLQPFSYVLWLTILKLLIFVAIIASIFKIILQKAAQNLDRLREWTFSDSVLWTLGAFCLQGWHQVPQEDCYRILILTMQLAGMVVNFAYNGVIISYLSVSTHKQTVSIKDFQDSAYTLAMEGNPLLLELVQKSFKPDRLKQIQVLQNASSSIYGIENVKSELLEGSLGFIGEDAAAYYALKHKFSPKEACGIGSAEVPHGVHSTSSMIPKGSPLTRIFNYKIIRFKEVGLESLWQRRYWPQKLPCKPVSFDSVDLIDVLFAFIILFTGKLLAILILLIELLRHMLVKCKRNQ